MIRRIMIGIIAVAVVTGGYLWLSQKKPDEYTGPVEKITVAAVAYLTGSLIYIAENQGCFEKNGLELTIKSYQSGKAAADALIDGEADISTSADHVFVSNSFNHPDLRVLGTIATAQVKGLVARKDKGIASIDDLRGKRIGVTRKSGAEFQLAVFLVYNLLEDIELVDLEPLEMEAAISTCDVDAVFTWDPYLYKIKNELGENAISWHGGQQFYFLLLTKKDWIKNNPIAVKRFMKSISEAENYIKGNPEESKKFVMDLFHYEPNYIAYSWPNQKFDVILSQAMMIAFDDQARWRIEQELTDAREIPNYLDYIFMDALKEVRPEAVTIVR